MAKIFRLVLAWQSSGSAREKCRQQKSFHFIQCIGGNLLIHSHKNILGHCKFSNKGAGNSRKALGGAVIGERIFPSSSGFLSTAKEIMYLVASVRLSVRPSVTTLPAEPLDLRHIRGSASPSAAKSSNHHYQSKVIVCVLVIVRRMQIIARMRSIGF